MVRLRRTKRSGEEDVSLKPHRSFSEARAEENILIMHNVYMLASLKEPTRCYIGTTTDLNSRLAQHNAGTNGYETVGFSPM